MSASDIERDHSVVDEDLVAAYLGGESYAAEALFRRHNRRFVLFIRCRLAPVERILCGRVAEDDLVQDAWLEIVRRLGEYDPQRGLFVLWARQICQNQVALACRMHLASAKRDVRREMSLGVAGGDSSPLLADWIAANLTSPTELARRNELKDQIHGLLQRLGEDDREILTLRHIEELTNDEAARFLRISPQAAGNRRRRALERLEALIRDLDLSTDGP